MDLDDPEVWAHTLQDRAEYFRKAMPMALESLAIAQHKDMLHYARIRSGAYRPQLRRFKVGNYVYLQREAPTTLDVKAGRTILRVKDILPSGVLLLEGKDGQECRDDTKNCMWHLNATPSKEVKGPGRFRSTTGRKQTPPRKAVASWCWGW